MIVSELGTVGKELGSKVELQAISADADLQKSQFELELTSIYESLAKKFSVDESIEIVTNSIELFLKAHKPS